jgi:predicted acylesterase/phospholipase RssA
MEDSGAFGLQEVLAQEHQALELGERAPIGLALSGGGIRSATFSLGVLQALAARRRLASFDYLSTVSGGGYIGSWLSAWIHRSGLREVQDRLAAQGSTGTTGAPASPEAAEVAWLRRYSSYLAPRVGLLSLDSLTLITTWGRNFLLNLIVLVGFLGSAFLLPLLLARLTRWAAPYNGAFGFAAAWAGALFLLGVAYNLWQQGLPVQRRRNWLISARGVGSTVIIPGVLSACFGAIWLFGEPAKTLADARSGLQHVAWLLGGLLAIWTAAECVKRRSFGAFRQLPLYAMAAAGGLAACMAALIGLYALWGLWTPFGGEGKLIGLVAFGPPAFLLALGFGTTIFTGLVGRVFFERSREWWSRLNAWLLTLSVCWTVWGLLAFFSLPLLLWIGAQMGSWISLLGTGWVGSVLAAIFLRSPPGASRNTELRVERVLNTAAIVFIAGLLFVLAAATQWALLTAAGTPLQVQRRSPDAAASYELRAPQGQLALRVHAAPQPEASLPDTLAAHFKALDALHPPASKATWHLPELALFSLLLLVLLFGWRVDINKFSLHNMYKNRLVRCYLGASNRGNRNEQPFTGLDDGDDLPLRELAHSRLEQGGVERLGAQRPLQLICTALNITQGSNLAWQERRAASFTFSALHCGYSLARTQGDTRSIEHSGWETCGYRPTATYATRDKEDRGFQLGMALATSGAAVSPNMGHASRPARAFVLTLFNVRLGRWSANPARHKWHSASPRLGLVPLLQELMGHSNEERNYVHLSDGGHFDNLGVYELVRRRCQVIFVVDAGADPDRALGDLAESIRKCRIDLGVEIRFPDLKTLFGDEHQRAETGHCRGSICYDPQDPSRDGHIVLIKPTMRRARDEPADLQHYAARNPPFPQQTTADQFFDESQFESYRRLGVHVAEHCLNEHQDLLPVVEPDGGGIRALTNEQPTVASRILFWLMRRDGTRTAPPGRDGSLVDFLACGAVLTVLYTLAFALLDSHFLGWRSSACWTTEACLESTQRLVGAARDAGDYLRARTILDNLFIIVYAATFFLGIAVGSHALVRGRKLARAVLVPLAAALLVVDYSENFLFADAVGAGLSEGAAAIGDIARLTALKFVLTALTVAGIGMLLPRIFHAFRTRWFPREDDSPGQPGRAQ